MSLPTDKKAMQWFHGMACELQDKFGFKGELRQAIERELWNAYQLSKHNATLVERDKARAELEQLQVQLAGCSVAATGCAGDNDCLPGAYGWSPAFEDVKKLRAEVDRYRANEAEIRKQLGRVATESKALREAVESASQRK